MALIGSDGPAVVLDARTCAFLEKYAGMSGLRVKVRGVDRHLSQQLLEVREAAMSWRGSSTGTDDDTKPEPGASSQWLSTVQAADLSGVTPRAVLKAIARGALPATRVGDRWRIAREDLEHYRAARGAA